MRQKENRSPTVPLKREKAFLTHTSDLLEGKSLILTLNTGLTSLIGTYCRTTGSRAIKDHHKRHMDHRGSEWYSHIGSMQIS